MIRAFSGFSASTCQRKRYSLASAHLVRAVSVWPRRALGRWEASQCFEPHFRTSLWKSRPDAESLYWSCGLSI